MLVCPHGGCFHRVTADSYYTHPHDDTCVCGRGKDEVCAVPKINLNCRNLWAGGGGRKSNIVQQQRSVDSIMVTYNDTQSSQGPLDHRQISIYSETSWRNTKWLNSIHTFNQHISKYIDGNRCILKCVTLIHLHFCGVFVYNHQTVLTMFQFNLFAC